MEGRGNMVVEVAEGREQPWAWLQEFLQGTRGVVQVVSSRQSADFLFAGEDSGTLEQPWPFALAWVLPAHPKSSLLPGTSGSYPWNLMRWEPSGRNCLMVIMVLTF